MGREKDDFVSHQLCLPQHLFLYFLNRNCKRLDKNYFTFPIRPRRKWTLMIYKPKELHAVFKFSISCPRATSHHGNFNFENGPNWSTRCQNEINCLFHLGICQAVLAMVFPNIFGYLCSFCTNLFISRMKNPCRVSYRLVRGEQKHLCLFRI